MEITGRCNYFCEHCYGSFPKIGELPKEKVEQLIDEARDFFDCIIFSGGEPFLHPHLREMIHCAKDFVVFITTSGDVLEEKQVEMLGGNVVLVFSLDGIGEVHDRYRGKQGAFKQLMNSLELVRKLPKEIIVTLWKGVVPQLEALIELAEKYCALIHFNALIPVGRARNNDKILLTPQESEEVCIKLQSLREQGAFFTTDLYRITEVDQEGIKLFCKGRYSVSPRGEVRPCEFHPAVLGNVFQESLRDVIERSRCTDLIQERERGFRGKVRLDLKDPFDYHTQICHRFSIGERTVGER